MRNKKKFNFKQITFIEYVYATFPPPNACLQLANALSGYCRVLSLLTSSLCAANNKAQTKELNENHTLSCIYSF